jgi:hypothetical protein
MTELIAVTVVTVAQDEQYTFRLFEGLNALTLTRVSDGYVAVCDDVTDVKFFLTVVGQGIATLPEIAGYFTFYPVD